MKSLEQPAVTNEVRQRLAALRPDSKRLWGKMSAAGAICHLSDAFLLALGEKHASDISNWFSRSIMKFGGLYLPLKWPPGVPTRPEMEQGVGGTKPVDFERDRLQLLQLIDRFVKADFAGVTHPIFGRMSQRDWLRWGYLHLDHHLRQFGQ